MFIGAVAACAAGGSTHDVTWAVVRADRDSSVAFVAYFHGSCDSLRSVHTIATSETVTFKIQVHEDSTSCDAAGRATAIRIRLGGKLGDRTITGACHPRLGILCDPRWALKMMDLHHVPIYGP